MLLTWIEGMTAAGGIASVWYFGFLTLAALTFLYSRDRQRRVRAHTLIQLLLRAKPDTGESSSPSEAGPD